MSEPRESEGPPAKRDLLKRAAIYILVLGSMLAGLELAARLRYSGKKPWYHFRGLERKERGVQALFLGTSRVAGSFDVQVFQGEVRRLRGPRFNAINLARPGSTLEEHRLGLRNLERAHPGCLRGMDVLLEAPGGRPDPSTPADPWYVDAFPQYLGPLLEAADLADLWSYGGSLEPKWRTNLLWMGQRSYLWRRRRSLRAAFLSRGEAVLDAFLSDLLPTRPEVQLAPEESLASQTQVEARRRTYEAARRKLRELVAERIAHPRPPVNWKETSLARLGSFLRSKGARLVLFYVPISSVQERELLLPKRKAEMRGLQAFLRRRGIPLLDTRIPVSDRDFPDLWHLRLLRRPEFSLKVARAWVALRSSATPK